MNTPTPAELWSTWMRAAQLMAQSQMVIGYRMLGMADLWSVTPSENARMFSEKPTAMMAAGAAATRAAMSGKRPDQIVDAALRPLSRKTGQNMRRLAKRGPK